MLRCLRYLQIFQGKNTRKIPPIGFNRSINYWNCHFSMKLVMFLQGVADFMQVKFPPVGQISHHLRQNYFLFFLSSYPLSCVLTPLNLMCPCTHLFVFSYLVSCSFTRTFWPSYQVSLCVCTLAPTFVHPSSSFLVSLSLTPNFVGRIRSRSSSKLRNS